MKTARFLGATPNLLELAKAFSPVSTEAWQDALSPSADEQPTQRMATCSDEDPRDVSGLVNFALCSDDGPSDDSIEVPILSAASDETGGLAGIEEVFDPSVCADDGQLPPAAPPFSFPNAASLCADEEPSDVRLKTDIAQVGTTVYGLPLYHFRYASGSERFEGVMAQDVLGVMPEAVVTGEDGFYRVNYRKLGIAMSRV